MPRLLQPTSCAQSNETHGHSWDLRHLEDAYELLKLGKDVRDMGRRHEDLDMSGVIQIKRFEQQVLDRGLFAAEYRKKALERQCVVWDNCRDENNAIVGSISQPMSLGVHETAHESVQFRRASPPRNLE